MANGYRDLYVSGQSMIGIFFVVSGFILTTKPLYLLRKQDHATLYKTIASCMFRRWFRLWLPAFFSTFIVVIAIRFNLKLDSPGGPKQHMRMETFSLQVKDWFLAMMRFSSPFAYRDRHEQLRMDYDWVTWTLPLEYWGGMSLWVVCMAVCQFPRYFVRLTILLLLCYFSLWNGAWHFFCFLAGMIISDLQIESKTYQCTGLFFSSMNHDRRQWLYWCILVFGLYIAGAPGAPEYDFWSMDCPGYRWLYSMIPHWFHEPYRYYLAWSGICIVFATNRIPALQRIFESDIPQAFSRCSFPFFLLHQTLHDILVKNWLGDAIARYLRINKETTLGLNIWFFLMMFISTPIIYAASRIFQTYIDGNCTKFAKWLEEQLRKPANVKALDTILPSHEARASVLLSTAA
jgi:hypothetical protein